MKHSNVSKLRKYNLWLNKEDMQIIKNAAGSRKFAVSIRQALRELALNVEGIYLNEFGTERSS